MIRRRPGLALATGVVVGGAMASNRAAQQQQQQMYQQQQQAQLNQARAEAEAAKQAAAQSSQPTVVYATSAAPTQAVAVQATPVQAAPAQPSSSVGRQMLNAALSGEPSADDLIALKKQLNLVQVMCDQALQLYQQSMQLTKQAQGANVTGAVAGAFRPGRGPSLMDTAFDAKRDAATKQALVPAEKASAMLLDGFKSIPDALRLRYPQEMSRVGNIPSASLAVGNFGKAVLMGAAFGQTGQNLNDIAMARKIRENEQELARCIATVNEQRQLMAIVQARLDQDIANQQKGGSSAAIVTATAATAVAAPPPALPALPPPPAVAPQPMLQLTAPHLVDESNPAFREHQIISVPAGAVVRLVKGSLSEGLGAPYNDYIEVEYAGKVGKISRLIVRPASGGPVGVPPPIGVPPAAAW